VHSHITLILEHHEGHDVAAPTVELYRTPDREVQIRFREADDESSALVGCPECVLSLLRGATAAVEEQLAGGRWLELDTAGMVDAAHVIDAEHTLDGLGH